MARTLSQRMVVSKMEFLLEHRNYLQTFVDETDKVLQLATSWLRNEDITKNITSSAMNKMIEDKLAFLLSKDFSVGCEEAATEQEAVATRSFPSAPKSTDQPLPAGHVHVSGVTVASDELKTVLSQVKVMQDAMCFLRTSSENMSEKQLAMEKLVESLSDKYSKVEQEKLREIEGELEGIKEKNKKAAIQQDKRMTSFEKIIQDLTDTQSDIIESCHQQQIKIKDQKKETEELKTQSQQLTKDLSDVLKNVQELNAEISVLEKKARTNTQMGALEGEIESLREGQEELSIRFEEHGSSLEELTQRNEETVKVLSSAQESESEKLQKLEKKISALEKNWNETTVENGKLCQDVNTMCEMVRQAITERIVPLEKLRDSFKGKLDARREHIEKLDNVCDQMTELLPRFSRVEQQTQRQAIGFSASLFFRKCSFIKNQTLIFPDVRTNIGYHYDSKTGEFTAPLDGLYAGFLFVDVEEGACPSFGIIIKPCYCPSTCDDCECITTELLDGTGYPTTFGIVEMKAGEKLCAQCLNVEVDMCFTAWLNFFCFKIG